MAIFDIRRTIDTRLVQSPQKSYLWKVLLPDLSQKIYNPPHGIVYSTEAAETINNMTKDVMDRPLHMEISDRIANITTPHSMIDTDKAATGNSFWYYAKHNDIGTISAEFYEYEDGLTTEYFTTWEKLMMNSDGTYNPPVLYKQQIKFYRLSHTYDELWVHTYEGYFVSGIGDITNDYESSDITKIPLTFTGDSVEIKKVPLGFDYTRDNEIALLQESIDFSKTLSSFDSVIAELIG